MISVGIIEDLEDYRNLLKVLLSHSEGLEVTFSVCSAEDGIANIKDATAPDVCIIDINLPGQSGIEFIKWIKKNTPDTLCLICTAYDTDDKVFQSLEAGAQGYILKSDSPSDIIEAIIELYKGGSPMSSQVARKVVQSFRKQPQKQSDYTLTQREEEVLDYLSKGLLYKEIAFSMNISIETVRRHCFNIYGKLHVNNRTEALNKYFGK